MLFKLSFGYGSVSFDSFCVVGEADIVEGDADDGEIAWSSEVGRVGGAPGGLEELDARG